MTQLDPNSIHLINRATFGPKLEWLNTDTKIILENLEKTQKWLFKKIDEYHPISNSNEYSYIFEKEQSDQIRIRKQSPIEGLIFDWINIMVSSPNPLREIVALFWHHHIPCGNVGKFEYNKLLLEIYRENGLGRLKPLITKIAENPAMMSWLSAFSSHKDNPNENFPRELMELFLLGGRSIHENADNGTEHGNAGPVIVLGGKQIYDSFINIGSIYETYNDYNTIMLKYKIDFRDVFNRVINKWLI